MKFHQKRSPKSTLVPFYRLLPFGITGSNDFVQSEENTSVPNSFNVKLELSLFDQFKLKGAKI